MSPGLETLPLMLCKGLLFSSKHTTFFKIKVNTHCYHPYLTLTLSPPPINVVLRKWNTSESGTMTMSTELYTLPMFSHYWLNGPHGKCLYEPFVWIENNICQQTCAVLLENIHTSRVLRPNTLKEKQRCSASANATHNCFPTHTEYIGTYRRTIEVSGHHIYTVSSGPDTVPYTTGPQQTLW